MKIQHIEDIINMQDEVLEISEIEKMIYDNKVLKVYETKYTNKLYCLVMKSLTHEVYNEENIAKETFERIISHLEELNNILGRDVGLLVATLDYLQNIIKTLDEPKIIEEDKSDVLLESSTIDELTTLYLRDIFDITVKKRVDESNRTKSPLSLIMMDIDDFKIINDTYGHQRGDFVLKEIGEVINLSIREMDMAARYGGEEFAILMPNTELNTAIEIAERIRTSIKNIDFIDFNVSVSIGVSRTDNSISSDRDLIESADFCLYQAKNKGKDRVESNEKNV
ncbi:MAG: hypothetical protein C0625_15905 [Arcobacter sp.]|nr:MAG: hypothetical protein C0625_15905 [Arcobacter sp.]